MWECGIEQCRDFASQLETVTFNYSKLSEIHVSMEGEGRGGEGGRMEGEGREGWRGRGGKNERSL